jgi:phospholipase D1/2
VGKFSHSLRSHLLKEHLGLLSEMNVTPLNIKVEDPLTSAFRFAVLELAVQNTLIFERVFHGRILPTNQVLNFEDLENWKSIPGLADILLEEAEKELDNIQGRVVTFPIFFLKDALKPTFLDYLGIYSTG